MLLKQMEFEDREKARKREMFSGTTRKAVQFHNIFGVKAVCCASTFEIVKPFEVANLRRREPAACYFS